MSVALFLIVGLAGFADATRAFRKPLSIHMAAANSSPTRPIENMAAANSSPTRPIENMAAANSTPTRPIEKGSGMFGKKATSDVKAAPAVVVHAGHSVSQSRQCFDMSAGDSVSVQKLKQRFGEGTYLVSRLPGTPDTSAEKALSTLYETVLEGCSTEKSWLVDVGAGTGEVSALAGSLGCRVAALDPDVSSIHSLMMTKCLNKMDTGFSVFPTMAAASPGDEIQVFKANSTDSEQGQVRGITVDGLFVTKDEQQFALKDDAVATTDINDDDVIQSEVALLKITPRECCSTDSTEKAMRGARKLLDSGRVKCLAMEVSFDSSTPALIDMLKPMEAKGYQLAHTGPMKSSALEISSSGAYVLYSLNTTQLADVYNTLSKIKNFDERSGLRAYGNGLSLNRDGQYFDYSELVIACRKFSDRLEIRKPGKVRFGNGMWWLERTDGVAAPAHEKEDSQ